MTSLSMALAGKGFTIDGAPVNPKTFNQWLKQNDGYTCIGKTFFFTDNCVRLLNINFNNQ
jgi:hypothetical protein